MRILVTGSCGLIGGEAVEYFGTRGHEIVGIDNNMRAKFFGPAGDTLWNLHRVAHKVPSYKHHETDICDGPVWNIYGQHNPDPEDKKIDALSMYVFKEPFDAVIHCAAQPSHDKALENPKLDHQVNVQGTHNVLDAVRRYSPNAIFIHMSTNKVYGESPNWITVDEHPTRYDFSEKGSQPSGVDRLEGFSEELPIDEQDPRLIFGLHKLEAERLVIEYAQRWGIKVAILRGGCLTGPGHSGVELHGFLSYLVRCALTGREYHVFGYKGKQVRDNVHSYDVMRAIEEIIKAPRAGEVYNIGGGRSNSASIIEAIDKIERMIELKVNWTSVDKPRLGDHICYITDARKLRSHYPNWSITRSLEDTLTDMIRIAVDELIQTEKGEALERLMTARDAIRVFNLGR